MSSNAHKKTLNLKNKNHLDNFIKSGGRKGARSDFDKILGKASKGKK